MLKVLFRSVASGAPATAGSGVCWKRAWLDPAGILAKMRCWRIAIKEAALDRSCEGAKKSGGHWHCPGVAALYGAQTVELAVLEKFVHCKENEDGLVLVAIDLPDDAALGLDVALEELPPGWDKLPSSDSAAQFGTEFLKANTYLYMRVPSTLVHEGTNLVINPLHPDYQRVRLGIVRSFSFDPRMFNPGD
jgi:RES domain-containing protein